MKAVVHTYFAVHFYAHEAFCHRIFKSQQKALFVIFVTIYISLEFKGRHNSNIASMVANMHNDSDN